VPLARVRSDVKYLKVTEAAKNRSVIIAMTAKELGETAEPKTGFAWNGKNNLDWSGRHLGIYNTDWNRAKRGNVSIFIGPNFTNYRGWGFGNHYATNDGQGYSWDGEPIPKTVFEIAVKSGPLAPEETRRLLKSKK
jgi:hypothetical protein